tara:strand:+ start:2804 stop:3229 length:426 start_codon:yes stop_codon:yes gene_type:complete
MYKFSPIIIILLISFNLQSQNDYFDRYNNMETIDIKEALNVEQNEYLIEMNNSLIDFMIEEIKNAIKNNYIDFERGINELTFLWQSQRNWKNYMESFTGYVGSAYLNGSMRPVVQKYEVKKHYILRNIELIETHKRWKMDQ